MKKLLFIALSLATVSATAQNAKKPMALKTPTATYVSVGPVAGVGASWVSGMGGTSMATPSGNIGIGLVYARNEHWGWGTQLTLSSEGYTVDYSYRAKGTPMYLRLPVRAYYFFGDFKNTIRPKAYLGPQVGVKVGEKDNMNGAYGDVTMANNTGKFTTMDFGVNAGLGLNIKLAQAAWLNLDLGYYQGLLDVIKDPADHYNMNQNLTFNAGVLFGIW
ncbi:MAG: PorT family protein [Taibaiella sp.]|nr:PorT family protein [Taibaiella sp.]